MTSSLNRASVNYRQIVSQSKSMIDSSLSSANFNNNSISNFDDSSMINYCHERIAKNKRNFEQQVRNMKPIVMKEASRFIAEQSEAITKLLTRAHHNLNKDFLQFKIRNDELID